MQFKKETKRLKFELSDSKTLLTFIYNHELGLKINEKFTDIDLQLNPSQPLYLVSVYGKLSITVGGLSYVDLIYQIDQETTMNIYFDKEYTDQLPVLQSTIKIPPDLETSLDWDYSSLADKKLYYKQQYIDGSICGHNNLPRSTTVVYYCDQYGTSDEMKIIDIMEPNYCEYHLKVTSKYMCAKLRTLPKASTRLQDITG